jgi:hypothetical protein
VIHYREAEGLFSDMFVSTDLELTGEQMLHAQVVGAVTENTKLADDPSTSG